jgi:hypothetical protein
MLIGQALRAHLIADPAIHALLVSPTEPDKVRIYALRLPQKAIMPSVVLTRIVGLRDGHLRGEGSLARPTYQVDAWAATNEAAVALGKLCRLRLAGFKGTWSDNESPVHTIRVTILFEEERDWFDEDILGGLCRHSADYRLFYQTLENTV